jgi:succinate dehydrogenase/fumarate reductase cytochrome b subunit (b558 family)
MNSFLKFYESSIGKKIIMSLTGLFLCTFLLEHMIGNLLLYWGEETYNAYTEMLVSNPIIRTIEFGLFATLIIHPIVGFALWLRNRQARPAKYDTYKLSAPFLRSSSIAVRIGAGGILPIVVQRVLCCGARSSRLSSQTWL